MRGWVGGTLSAAEAIRDVTIAAINRHPGASFCTFSKSGRLSRILPCRAVGDQGGAAGERMIIWPTSSSSHNNVNITPHAGVDK